MSPRRRKILSYFAMFLSIDVLVASILSLILMWLAFLAAGNMFQNLFMAESDRCGRQGPESS